MKLKICFPALLCLFFGFRAAGQKLKIGDKVPDRIITGVSGLKDSYPVSGGQIKLSAFAGKLLILDFWATWCAPCRKMVPVMDSLQRVFGDQVVFLPVTYESAGKVAPVLAALYKIKPFQLPEVTGDQVLHNLFPHRSLPHYVWIDGKGVVRAITEEKQVTADNIRKLLSSGALAVQLKQDSVASYNNAQPLLIAGNGGDGSGLVYHSLLTTYKPGLAGGLSVSAFDTQKGQRFTLRNAPLPWLFRMAFGENGRVFPRSRIVYQTRDSAKMDTRLTGLDYDNWLAAGSGWCYELVLSPAQSRSAYSFMQADLLRLFPEYRVVVERRNKSCLALVRTSGLDKLKSRGGPTAVAISPYLANLQNAHLSQLMMRLERQYLQNSALPIVDATNYQERVDLTLQAKLYDIAELNRALAPYDLRLEERNATVEVLVIRDATPAKSSTKSNQNL
jgi:thiol-disulfide isomerase/thioredoxin